MSGKYTNTLVFKNKTFLVTGGSSGIGLSAATQLAALGAKVYITGRNADAIRKAAAEIEGNVVGLVADTGAISASAKVAEEIGANGDKLDGVFLNAGAATFKPFEYITEKDFDNSFNTNVKGTYFLIQKLLPVIQDGASVVFTGSAGFNAGPQATSVYLATKAALNSLAKTLSRDLLARRIRFNVVNPGGTETPGLGKSGMPIEVVRQIMSTQVPLGRLGRPDEITGYVLFLLSDQSTYILGTELSIDGGMTQL